MAFNITPSAILSNVLTAANLLTSISNVDVVAVLDQESLQQIFPNARPLEAEVRETARVMDYPVETGAILSDHRVINPTEINIPFLISQDYYSSAYEAIRNAWLNATKLSVQTRTGTYRNMIISDIPHREDAEQANAITIFVRLREVIFVAPSSVATPDDLANYSPRDPVNNLPVDRGLIFGIEAVSGVLSYFRALSVWGL